MPHEITSTDSASFRRKPAWHSLGNIHDGEYSAVTLGEREGMLWDVLDVPSTFPVYEMDENGIVFDDNDGNKVPRVLRHDKVPGLRTMVRSDNFTPLATVGGVYKIFQNRQLAELVDGITEKKYEIESALTIDGGKKIVFLAKYPEDIVIAGDDKIKDYIALTNSHDGKMKLSIFATPTRIVCANTLTFVLQESGGQGYRIRHSNSMDRQVESALHTMKSLNRDKARFVEESNKLASTDITATKAREYFSRMLESIITVSQDKLAERAALQAAIDKMKADKAVATGEEIVRLDTIIGAMQKPKKLAEEKRRENVLADIVSRYNADPANGTAWGAYNAVNESAIHGAMFDYRGNERSRNERRFMDTVNGKITNITSSAFAAARGLS